MGAPVYFEGLFWLGTMFVYAFRENPWRESMDSIRDQREPSELCEELCEELSELCERHGDNAQCNFVIIILESTHFYIFIILETSNSSHCLNSQRV